MKSLIREDVQAVWAFTGRGMAGHSLLWPAFLLFFAGPLAVGTMGTSEAEAWGYGVMYGVVALNLCVVGRRATGGRAVSLGRERLLPVSTTRLAVCTELIWYAMPCAFLLAACAVTAGIGGMPWMQTTAQAASVCVITGLGAFGLGGVGGAFVIAGTWALVLYSRGFVVDGNGGGWGFADFVIQVVPVILVGGIWWRVRIGRLRRGAQVWAGVGLRSARRSGRARVVQGFGSVEAAQRWEWFARFGRGLWSVFGVASCALACLAGALCGGKAISLGLVLWGWFVVGWPRTSDFGLESMAARMAMRAQPPEAVVGSYRKNGLLLVGVLVPFAVLGLWLANGRASAAETLLATAYVVALLWGGVNAWLTSWVCATGLWGAFLVCAALHTAEVDPYSIRILGDMVRGGMLPHGIDCVVSWVAAAAMTWSAIETFKEAAQKRYVGRVVCALAACAWAVLVLVPLAAGLGWVKAVSVPAGWALSVAAASFVVGQYAELPLFVAAGRRVGIRWFGVYGHASRGRCRGENW